MIRRSHFPWPRLISIPSGRNFEPVKAEVKESEDVVVPRNTRVKTTVAMELAASCNPLNKSKTSATAISARRAIAGGHACSGGPPGKRNGQYRHGERTKAAIAEQRKFSALLKMLRAGLT